MGCAGECLKGNTVQFDVGGWNLNDTVSDFLQTSHPMVDIEILPYIGRTNDRGNVSVQYGDPIPMMVQTQLPSDRALQHIRAMNDNAIRRAFWISSPVFPMNRNLRKGADRIRYDGNVYEITWLEDFSVTGWVQVIGEEILNDDL